MSHSDDAIEREIVSKGLTAPRITPDDIKANIASEHYFTAEQGAHASFQDGEGDPPHYGGPLSSLTFCVLVLQNGFTVTGKSACASPENFDAEIGKKIAREDAIQQMWPLMGYALKEQLHANAPKQEARETRAAFFDASVVVKPNQVEASVPAAMPPHQQRVLDEKRDLDEKLNKLGAFISGNPVFKGLPFTEQADLIAQRDAMEQYSCILADRIARFGGAA